MTNEHVTMFNNKEFVSCNGKRSGCLNDDTVSCPSSALRANGDPDDCTTMTAKPVVDDHCRLAQSEYVDEGEEGKERGKRRE